MREICSVILSLSYRKIEKWMSNCSGATAPQNVVTLFQKFTNFLLIHSAVASCPNMIHIPQTWKTTAAMTCSLVLRVTSSSTLLRLLFLKSQRPVVITFSDILMPWPPHSSFRYLGEKQTEALVARFNLRESESRVKLDICGTAPRWTLYKLKSALMHHYVLKLKTDLPRSQEQHLLLLMELNKLQLHY